MSTSHDLPHCSHYGSQQAWIREDEGEASSSMQDALSLKCQKTNEYIKFISHFGPALTGTAFWNTNKTTKLVSELLTITDEAFIQLCIINYIVQLGRLRKKRNREKQMYKSSK